MLLLFATDIIDGSLARLWHVTTPFGYVLDGVADRSTHLALLVAVAYTRDLSPFLVFLLIFRDIVLYAARSLFRRWWSANPGFRWHVKSAAILFKITAGGVALLSYERILNLSIAAATVETARSALVLATWIFAAWSYVLLALQIRRYVQHDREPGGTE